MRGLLIIPSYSIDTTKNKFHSALSPFNSYPATTDPLISLTNLNVLLAGENLIHKDMNYSYEMFQQQLEHSFNTRGNLVPGIKTGLISK